MQLLQQSGRIESDDLSVPYVEVNDRKATIHETSEGLMLLRFGLQVSEESFRLSSVPDHL